jgi:hypothetical protein
MINRNANSNFPLTNKNFMFISKQETITKRSISEQLRSDRLKQKEVSVLTQQFWKKQALCLPAALVKKLRWLTLKNVSKSAKEL